MTTTFPPPSVAVDALVPTLAAQGHAVLLPQAFAQWTGTPLAALEDWRARWHELPPDRYLRDGGRYRRRRHSSFVVDGDAVRQVAHRAHWQPVSYNALHGGLERWFEPMAPALCADPAWLRLLRTLGATCSALKGAQPWYLEAHQFRIDTTDGIGRPTPEGAHRDGVDFVAVILVDRHAVKGGESRVFEADGPQGQRFTLVAPWTMLLLDDARVIHETTPIQPDGDGPAWRDTLVLTCRARGFQDPGAA